MKTYFGLLLLGAFRWLVTYNHGDISPNIRHDAIALHTIFTMVENANAPVNIKELLVTELKDLEGE
jgi:hypothetical protein